MCGQYWPRERESVVNLSGVVSNVVSDVVNTVVKHTVKCTVKCATKRTAKYFARFAETRVAKRKVVKNVARLVQCDV